MDANTITSIPKLCKCGCGAEIVFKPHHRYQGVPDFIKGHGSRMPGHFVPTHSIPHSEESKRRMGETRTGLYRGEKSYMYGKHLTEETKKKISVARVGKYGGENNPFYGKHWSEENKRIQSEMRRKQYAEGNNPFQGRKHTHETLENIREKAVARNASPEYRKKISECTRKGMTADVCEKLSVLNKERCNSPVWRKMKSEEGINRWKNDKEFAERMRSSRNAKPNKSEVFLGGLLNEMYPGEWKFTGDFSLMINGKNPDFVNCNGKKLIIELFGEPWHKGETQEDRAKFFSPFGYKTLVVWWEELKKIDILKSKIERFCND